MCRSEILKSTNPGSQSLIIWDPKYSGHFSSARGDVWKERSFQVSFQMLFGYLIAAENLMRQRRGCLWALETFLIPICCCFGESPLISLDEPERCSVQKGDSSPTEKWPILGALVGWTPLPWVGAWVVGLGVPCSQGACTTDWSRKR